MTTANNAASYYLADQCDEAAACHPPNSLSFVEASMADAKKISQNVGLTGAARFRSDQELLPADF